MPLTRPVQADKVLPVERQHGPPLPRGKRQHLVVRRASVGEAGLDARVHVVSHHSQVGHHGGGEVLVGHEPGHRTPPASATSAVAAAIDSSTSAAWAR
jgi:hypothetical protein